LSGGNQQKISLGKWLATESAIFILDEPTAGIDVGAKRELYELIADLARNGAAILLVSSEIPELLSMSNRILVMRKGRLSGEPPGEGVTEEEVLNYAT
jgi:ribose transport system ATP-binding protein